MLANTLRKVGLPCKNSNKGRSITHASIGLHRIVSMHSRTSSLTAPYWLLNSSRGGSTGVDANARSGRREDRTELKLAAKVGGESSEIFWYALERLVRQGAAKRAHFLKRQTDLTTAEAAKFVAQHVMRMKFSSSVSLIRLRYGLSFPASDL